MNTNDANKGIISLILPDELRPIAVQSNMPIDLVFNPFSVFSRMNLSQLLEGMVSKNVMACDKFIKTRPNRQDVIDTIKWLNEGTIKNLTSKRRETYDYYKDINNLISWIENDDDAYEKFINNICDNNLFIEAPSFSQVNINELFKNSLIFLSLA